MAGCQKCFCLDFASGFNSPQVISIGKEQRDPRSHRLADCSRQIILAAGGARRARDVRNAGACRQAPEDPDSAKNGQHFRDAKDLLPPAGLYCIARLPVNKKVGETKAEQGLCIISRREVLGAV